MHVAVQFIQHKVVPLAKAQVFGQAEDLHPRIAKIRFCQLLTAAVGAGVIHDIQNKIGGLGIVQDAAHGGADFLVITVRYDAGTDFCHNYFSNASRCVRS